MINELNNLIQFAEKNEIPKRVSPSVFFSQMKNIESELGHRVIKSFQGRFMLTEFGKSFIPYAQKGLQDINEGIEVSSKYNIYDSYNQITLGIARDSAYTWAMNCIKGFNKIHPGLRLTVLVDDYLTEEIVDKATIIFWSYDKSLTDYDKPWCIEYKYGLYASNEYLENYGTPTLANIKDHKIIAYSGTENYEITNWHLLGNKYGLPKLTPVIFCQSRDLIAKMISEGIGIGSTSDHQDAYYGYNNLNQVVKIVAGPILRSHFFIRKGLSYQTQNNA